MILSTLDPGSMEYVGIYTRIYTLRNESLDVSGEGLLHYNRS